MVDAGETASSGALVGTKRPHSAEENIAHFNVGVGLLTLCPTCARYRKTGALDKAWKTPLVASHLSARKGGRAFAAAGTAERSSVC